MLIHCCILLDFFMNGLYTFVIMTPCGRYLGVETCMSQMVYHRVNMLDDIQSVCDKFIFRLIKFLQSTCALN